MPNVAFIDASAARPSPVRIGDDSAAEQRFRPRRRRPWPLGKRNKRHETTTESATALRRHDPAPVGRTQIDPVSAQHPARFAATACVHDSCGTRSAPCQPLALPPRSQSRPSERYASLRWCTTTRRETGPRDAGVGSSRRSAGSSGRVADSRRNRRPGGNISVVSSVLSWQRMRSVRS
jgi:hypothetical protein